MPKVAHPLRRPGQRQGIGDHQHDQDEQGRYRQLAEALDPGLHAPCHDPGADRQEHQMHSDGGPCRRDEIAEQALRRFRGGPDEIEGASLEQIKQRPTPDHAVIAQDDHRNEDGQQAGPAPCLMGGIQPAHGRIGTGPAPAADRNFRDENRQGDQQGGDDIGYDEDRAAMLPGHVGKAPDIAQADRRSGHSINDSPPAAKVFSVAHKLLCSFVAAGVRRAFYRPRIRR